MKQFKIRKHVFLFLFVTSVSIYVLLQWSEFVHCSGNRIKIRGFNFFFCEFPCIQFHFDPSCLLVWSETCSSKLKISFTVHHSGPGLILDPIPRLSWFSWFSTLLRVVFPQVLLFSPLTKNEKLIVFDLIWFNNILIWVSPISGALVLSCMHFWA